MLKLNLKNVLKRKTVEIALKKNLYKVCAFKSTGKTYKLVYASVTNIENGFDNFIPLGIADKITKLNGQNFDLVFFHPLDIEEQVPAAEKICKIDNLRQLKKGRVAVKIKSH